VGRYLRAVSRDVAVRSPRSGWVYFPVRCVVAFWGVFDKVRLRVPFVVTVSPRYGKSNSTRSRRGRVFVATLLGSCAFIWAKSAGSLGYWFYVRYLLCWGPVVVAESKGWPCCAWSLVAADLFCRLARVHAFAVVQDPLTAVLRGGSGCCRSGVNCVIVSEFRFCALWLERFAARAVLLWLFAGLSSRPVVVGLAVPRSIAGH